MNTTRPVSVPHLVVGLIFLGLAGMWLLRETTDLEGVDISVWGPGLLIGAGVVGLLAFLVGSARRNRPEPTPLDEWYDDQTPSDTPEEPS